MFSAARFNVDTVPYPTLRAIYEACEAIPAVAAAHPSRQMDAE
jgi:maleylpyruvate isomerase